MKCGHCEGICTKKGKTPKGIQKHQCKSCGKYQRDEYRKNGFKGGIENQVKTLIKEGCGIRSISRILKISTSTVLRIIRLESEKISKPVLRSNREYEADELKTFIKRKKNYYWIMYAIDRKTRKVADFRVGKRTKTNLRNLVDTLLISKAKIIYTDKLNIYPTLIPKEQHKAVAHNTNYIERNNLNLRTHLKRLNRKTICYSKSILMLTAIMKIYFWG